MQVALYVTLPELFASTHVLLQYVSLVLICDAVCCGIHVACRQTRATNVRLVVLELFVRLPVWLLVKLPDKLPVRLRCAVSFVKFWVELFVTFGMVTFSVSEVPVGRSVQSKLEVECCPQMNPAPVLKDSSGPGISMDRFEGMFAYRHRKCSCGRAG